MQIETTTSPRDGALLENERMAHYVEKHFNPNTGSMVPGYWNPDYSLLPVSVAPCNTKEQAEQLEREADQE